MPKERDREREGEREREREQKETKKEITKEREIKMREAEREREREREKRERETERVRGRGKLLRGCLEEPHGQPCTSLEQLPGEAPWGDAVRDPLRVCPAEFPHAHCSHWRES